MSWNSIPAALGRLTGRGRDPAEAEARAAVEALVRDEWVEDWLLTRFCGIVRNAFGAVQVQALFVQSVDNESLSLARRGLVAAALRRGWLTAESAERADPWAEREARRRAFASEALSLVLASSRNAQIGILFVGLMAPAGAVPERRIRFLEEMFSKVMEARERILCARAALRRDRLAAVGSIASFVSHRVRNNLAVLRGALELLQAGFERDLSQEYRETLLREFDEFIADFNLGVDMMRADFGVLAVVSAREVTEEAVRAFRGRAERQGIELVTAFAHSSDRILADRRLLKLALLNLLRNATEALASTPSGRIAVRTANENGWLHIEVADNGPGVPVAIHERIMLETVTAKGDGTGLGLSLVRDAMTLMNGTLRLVTPPGRPGACFRLSLPPEKR